MKDDSPTPAEAWATMLEGNARFVAGEPRSHDDLAAAATTAAEGQHPLVAVLSCIDSRVPVEVVLDLGIGEAFVARVAGNVADAHTLGGLEFATELAGTPVLVVLGHTSCGAVKGAIAGAELGHLTGLLADIAPAVQAVGGDDVDAVVAENVDRTVERFALVVRADVHHGVERDDADPDEVVLAVVCSAEHVAVVQHDIDRFAKLVDAAGADRRVRGLRRPVPA